MRYDCLGDALGCKVCSRFVVRQPGDFFCLFFLKVFALFLTFCIFLFLLCFQLNCHFL